MIKWTSNEIDILEKFYPVTDGQEIAIIFQNFGIFRTYKSIIEKAKALKIRKVSYKKVIDQLLIEKYSNSPLNSVLENARNYIPNLSKEALIARANRLGLDRRKYSNSLFEKTIKKPRNSKDFAWFLGALAGDGYVSPFPNKWRIYRIRLFVTSKEFAEKFGIIGKKLFGIEYFINIYGVGINEKWKPRYACSFISKKAVELLGNWKENMWYKTLNGNFSWIFTKKSYASSFLSSYFDSDGSVIVTPQRYRIEIASRDDSAKKTLGLLLNILGIKKFSSHGRAIEIANKEGVKKFVCSITSSIPYKEVKLKILRSLP